MEKQPTKKEETRGLKHLLIHQLFKNGYELFEPLGPQRGQDLVVGKIFNGKPECIVAQVRTCSLSDKKDYVFNIPGRDDFVESPKFFHLICLENRDDDLRPTFLAIPNPKLKQLVEKKLKRSESWKREKDYGFHLSIKQLKEKEWQDLKNKSFRFIDEALSTNCSLTKQGNKEEKN